MFVQHIGRPRGHRFLSLFSNDLVEEVWEAAEYDYERDQRMLDIHSRELRWSAWVPIMPAEVVQVPPEIEVSEVEVVMALESSRFQSAPQCSRGGIPATYVDHLVHLRDRRKIRQIAEEEVYDLSAPRV